MALLYHLLMRNERGLAYPWRLPRQGAGQGDVNSKCLVKDKRFCLGIWRLGLTSWNNYCWVMLTFNCPFLCPFPHP